MAERSVIGRSRRRSDALPKVRGATRYQADRWYRGAVHARLVLAPYAHARLLGIDADEARGMPGVVAVLTAGDLGLTGGTDRATLPLVAAEVVFAGQPIALVLAESEEQAADAAELVTGRYEPLPVVLDPSAAMAVDSPLARSDVSKAATGGSQHAAIGGEGDHSIEAEVLSPNVVKRVRYRHGDAEAGLGQAAARVRRHLRTSWIHQGYLEPQACAAWIDADGTIVVETSTQAAFSARNMVARALGRPTTSVRVVPAPLGGAFGGKWPIFEGLVAAAALRVGRPVRLVLDRLDDFMTTSPGQAIDIEIEVGGAADGTLVALEARIVADAGAYADESSEELAAVLVGGPYRWPSADVRSYSVHTNRFAVGPYRGPAAPQAAFAIESVLDELAAALGVDPLELRRRNLVAEGDPMLDDTVWPAHGLRDVLDVVERLPLWAGRSSLPPNEGIGLAVGTWPGFANAAAARCRVSPDGTIQVVTGAVDMSGTSGAFEAIAAEILGVDPDRVRIVTVDTGSAPQSPGSGGSTVTHSVGRAVRLAAEDARRQILQAAAQQLEIHVDDLEIVDGVVRPRGTPDRAIPLDRVVRAHDREGRAPIDGHGSSDKGSIAPSVAAFVSRVRVDPDTGVTEVLELDAVQDVGRVINPALVAGQQLGAAAQAVGWATLEALVHDDEGQLISGTFLDYAIPRAAHMPEIRDRVVELPSPDGPFGAKGIGEAAVVGAPAAIVNAIAAATGVRPDRLPVTAPRLWRLLRDR
ncbi:MAG TPA: xanthine dehydrogenase family protein molybdopterin-binding subunit [Candidatus Limnocylindrales bacterium]|nr:xanthine dehydrogenase family protein molybdopterin-binding subunit [Candidatus Limnocylindrales bacterium]